LRLPSGCWGGKCEEKRGKRKHSATSKQPLKRVAERDSQLIWGRKKTFKTGLEKNRRERQVQGNKKKRLSNSCWTGKDGGPENHKEERGRGNLGSRGGPCETAKKGPRRSRGDSIKCTRKTLKRKKITKAEPGRKVQEKL